MADDEATRSRRKRAHARGDHSLCGARCRQRLPLAAEAAEPVAEASPAGDTSPGGIEQAVAAYVAALPFAASDPRAILGQLAVKLARHVDGAVSLPAAVRELRVVLAQIAEVPGQPAGQVDEIRLRRAQRLLDTMLAQIGKAG